MGFDADIFLRYGSRLAYGFGVTIELLSLSCLFGLTIALAANALSRSHIPGTRRLVQGYVFCFRGTPLLAQAFLIYYGAGQFRSTLEPLGLWGLFRDAFTCGIIALSLNTGAYTTAILDGALRAVPGGIVEACWSLGLRRCTAYRRIILPLAFRLVLPSYGNEIVVTFKGTAILSVISVDELMAQTRLIFSRTFALEIFLLSGTIYLVTTIVFQLFWGRLQSSLNRHLAH